MPTSKDYRPSEEFFTKDELKGMDYAFKVSMLAARAEGKERFILAVMKPNPKVARATRQVIGIIEPFSGTGSPAAMCAGY
jgi:hypothetical protein